MSNTTKNGAGNGDVTSTGTAVEQKKAPYVYRKELAGRSLWLEVQSWPRDGKLSVPFLRLNRGIMKNGVVDHYEQSRVYPEDITVMRRMLDNFEKALDDYYSVGGDELPEQTEE